MHHSHAHHSLRLSRALHSSLGLFEWSVWMHTFARSLISIFVPILLLQAGYAVGEVMVYFLIFNAVDIPLNFLSRWLIKRVGARLVIIMGSLFMLAYFLSLSGLSPEHWGIVVMIAVFAAAYDALYWVAHLYYFMVCSKHKQNISRDTSGLFIVQQLAEVLAPAIGAGLIILFGDQVLIYVSAAVVALSIIPLFRIRGVPDRPTAPSQPFRSFFGRWEVARDYVSTMLYGIHMSAELELFPIFLFLLLGNVESVAAVAVLGAAAMIIFTFFAGRIQRSHRVYSIIIGSFVAGMLWLLRLGIDDSIFLYASIFVVGFCSVMISVPVMSTLFEKGARIDPLSASTYRNASSMFSKVILYTGLVVAVYVFHVSFISAAGALFAILLIHYGARQVMGRASAAPSQT